MGDYEDTFHPNGTDGDDVEEMPSSNGWYDDGDYATHTSKDYMKNFIWIIVASIIAFGAYVFYSSQEVEDIVSNVKSVIEVEKK